MNATEAKKSGLVYVGEFGLPGHSESQIYAKPEDEAAVRAAYDAIDGDDLGLDAIDDVLAAGGIWLED